MNNSKQIKPRLLNIKLPKGKSVFLWGPRKVGKTFWLKNQFLVDKSINHDSLYIDLLKTDLLVEYLTSPSLLRERYHKHPAHLIVIDEIQKVPGLLDEVHWLIENTNKSFILTGSSARKLKRNHANMLGGRAWRRIMTPLSITELYEKDIDLEHILNSGLLPSHYLSNSPIEELRGYVADYLKEEIIDEASVQNIPAFSNFLNVMAITNSELLDYTKVASESGVSSKVVRTYFDILEDTYLGFRVPPWTKSKERRMIQTEKFYLFDVGVANYLAKRKVQTGSSEFGKSFEHLILMELKAYQAYRNQELDIKFWRTASGYEVDFIIGNALLAIEIKAKKKITEKDLKGLSVISEEMKVKKKIIVSLESTPRKITLHNGKLTEIEILPWLEFIKRLWAGEYL
ncbi:MAG: ATP-binding protein [Oligoflexia bacterium]|nr:ATP-binding protein [Oligoflexia bacterium]